MERLFRKIGIITCLAVILTAIQAVVPVSAATITALTDQMTTQAVGTAANHTLSFTTGTGATEGSTIVFTFDAAFNTASIVEDDVDILDDGSQLTTAATCSGVQASVVMSSDVLTMTICAGGGGAIAAGSVVTVRIGTHAVGSGTGTNRITNPSSVGTYSVRLSGTFGDVGNVWMPMVPASTGGISILAGISAGGGGGGPGPGPDPILCGDTTPPVISDVAVATGATSATIVWMTNEPATSIVNYGLTTSYGSVVNQGALIYSHSLSISGLVAGGTYQFQVSSLDICNNATSSGNFSFTTTYTDTTPPVISDIESDPGMTSAVIGWETNETTSGGVQYGLTSVYGLTATSSSTDTAHRVTLPSLSSGTTYHFRIRAADLAGNEAFSEDRTFTTSVDLPPSNVIGLIAIPGDGQITLNWILPSESDLVSIRIVYGADGFPTSPTDGAIIPLGLVNSYVHTGLTNGKTYFYAVFIYDAAGQVSSGAIVSATPVAPILSVCGDFVCASDETTLSCPADCAVPILPVCGDAVCASPSETPASCPSDCTTVVEVTAVCGDGACGVGESALSCASDCVGPIVGSLCGDAICSADESASTCPTDCGVLPTSSCGDGVCAATESSLTCESDCVETEVLLPTPSSELSSVAFLAGNDLIHLPSASGAVDVIPGRAILIRVETPLDVPSLVLRVGEDTYLLPRTGDGSYQSVVIAPSAVGTVRVSIERMDGDHEVLAQYTWHTKAFGFTFEILEGGRERIGSRVTLFSDATGVFFPWEAASYGQLNPVTTSSDGVFAWYVPLGRYYARAQADGYRPTQTAPTMVANAIATWDMELVRERTVESVLASPAPILPKLGAVAGIFFQASRETLDAARNVPAVQRGVDVASPLLLSTGAVSTAVLATSFNLLSFLQYLVTSPILFFFRRRRKSWGMVYDTLTKLPVDLAVVRLYRLSDGRLIQSRVTDKFGRYFFFADPGQYRLSASKGGYLFPSDLLKGQRADGGYLDLYHGEVVAVNDEHASIAANIPLDPSQKSAEGLWKVRMKKFLRDAQQVVAVAGVLLAVVVVVLRPGALSYGVLAFQVGVYLLAKRLARTRKPKGWGIVYDAVTRNPVANAIVRVFEPVYNKLLATAVTDRRGRYNVLVGPSEYYARYEKDGYQEREVRPIDFRGSKGPAEVKEDVPLTPKPPDYTS